MTGNAVLIALMLALSPMPVVASLLLLTSVNGRTKAATLAAGWIAGVGGVCAVTVFAADQLKSARSGGSPGAAGYIDIGLGVLALLYVLRLRRRSRRGGSGQAGWMDRVDRMRPASAFGLGAFLPTYVLVVAAANEIVRTDATVAARAAAVATVIVIGSLGVISPLLVSVVARDPDALLARWRRWMLAHCDAVLTWVMVLAGAYLVAKGAFELAR
jgi:hypothetical protein